MPPALVEQVRSLVGPKMDAVEASLVACLDDCPAHLRESVGRVAASVKELLEGKP